MNNKNDIVIVTGISGAGKDYLLKRVLDKNPQIASRFSSYSFGTEVFKRVNQINQTVQHRDQLKDSLDQEVLNTAVMWVVNFVISQQPVILNTHIAYKQNGSIQINPTSDKALNSRDYIFVRTEPELLLERRMNDDTRNRGVEDILDIDMHQEIALQAALVIARAIGANFHIIENTEEDNNNNTDKIAKIISLD